MNEADSDFLKQLFRENNELRLKYNAAQREFGKLYNKGAQNDSLEDELRQLKAKLEGTAAQALSDRNSSAATSTRPQERAVAPANTHALTKDLQEAMLSLERKTFELKQLSEELMVTKKSLEDQTAATASYKNETLDLKKELSEIRAQHSHSIVSEAHKSKREEIPPADLTELKAEVEVRDTMITTLRKQAMEIAMDADRKNNELQNQVQGIEVLIDGIRKEYEEFIQVTKLETESFRVNQLNEYNQLKQAFEASKLAHHEEKRRLGTEYTSLLYSMQSQFEEYRTSTEYMFSSEISRLEDELALQATKYEHEIMYVIQAKDKFYSDLMVSKDAKIMNLIEGSDLQTLMQKHELDLENLRKDHAREIDMVKSDQESEQKSVVALLQRQNSSLESKCEKLQIHAKALETRIKELTGTVEAKMKLLSDREDARLKMEMDYEAKISEYQSQISALSQEKENLRHKVIRLNLDAKGEGGNSVENIIKRISHETNKLHVEFEELSSRYDELISENQILVKKLKEREKFSEFLEKEVARRTEEYVMMTNTFEDFISGRARHHRRDRAKKLAKLGSNHEIKFPETSSTALMAKPLQKPKILKAVIPDKDDKAELVEEESAERKLELERGQLYLRKFKTLSKVFANGDFRILPTTFNNSIASDAIPGPWQKTALYKRIDDTNLALARLYKEPVKSANDPSSKPAVYGTTGNTQKSDTKIYADDPLPNLLTQKSEVTPQSPEQKTDIKRQILVGKSLGKN
ncbi:hypothetical protein HDU84_006221 [Entophlyctis sp. JEL0112]|nr:hypothetical protein HDU84_006221 [Entophlyctis sp. JEL0112]